MELSGRSSDNQKIINMQANLHILSELIACLIIL